MPFSVNIFDTVLNIDSLDDYPSRFDENFGNIFTFTLESRNGQDSYDVSINMYMIDRYKYFKVVNDNEYIDNNGTSIGYLLPTDEIFQGDPTYSDFHKSPPYNVKIVSNSKGITEYQLGKIEDLSSSRILSGNLVSNQPAIYNTFTIQGNLIYGLEHNPERPDFDNYFIILTRPKSGKCTSKNVRFNPECRTERHDIHILDHEIDTVNTDFSSSSSAITKMKIIFTAILKETELNISIAKIRNDHYYKILDEHWRFCIPDEERQNEQEYQHEQEEQEEQDEEMQYEEEPRASSSSRKISNRRSGDSNYPHGRAEYPYGRGISNYDYKYPNSISHQREDAIIYKSETDPYMRSLIGKLPHKWSDEEINQMREPHKSTISRQKAQYYADEERRLENARFNENSQRRNKEVSFEQDKPMLSSPESPLVLPRKNYQGSGSSRASASISRMEESPVTDPDEENEEEEEESYEVESILKKRTVRGKVQYLVQWEGKDPKTRRKWRPTWEPIENLKGSKELIDSFEEENNDMDAY